MKSMRYLLGLALIVSVASPSFALTGLNLLAAPNSGPVDIKFQNFDTGQVYGGMAPFTVVEGVDTVNSFKLLNQTQAMLWEAPIFGPNGDQNEDSWGYFRVTSIEQGNTQIWTDTGDPTKELVGIFYGLVDNAVVAYGDEVRVQSFGGHFDLWLQPKDSYAPELGSTGRFAPDKMIGVGYANNAGDLLPGAVKVLEAVTTEGTAPITGLNGDANSDNAHWVSDFTPGDVAQNVGVGSANFTLDVIGGEWQEWFEAAPGTYGSDDADLRGESGLKPNDEINVIDGPIGNLPLVSNDPVSGQLTVIPEPMTMGALGMAIAGLGGYIRRRRR